ncbi:MAG TPA: hypothetical protein VHX65_14635, partial [Pirellulales bacterium]|nr:hypothetical protein [Pirellulales bacterium]
MLRAESLEKRAMLSVSPNLGILTLDTTSSGSLVHSGSGSIVVTSGDIVVDSASAAGAEGSGSGHVSANNVYVHGNLSAASGQYLGNVVTGSAAVADPLAALPLPTAPATTYYDAVVNGASVTLSPGTYIGRIQISGNAHVTLLPGLYYLEGGMSISGGTVTGTGVTIYDSINSISISGSASVSLSAPTSGVYQGIVLFQNRTNIRPISISGSATVNLTGEVYIPDAQFQVAGTAGTSIHGNGSTIPGALIVDDLSVSGGANLAVAANAGGLSGDLSITKTDNLGGSSASGAAGLASAGGTIVYTITVANNGPSAAVGATVSDAFPAAIASDTYTVATTGGAADLTHTSGSGAIADSVYLPIGSTITYTVAATISASATGLITNAASIGAPALFTDTNTANNTASLTDNLLKADLAITDTDNEASAVPGTPDTYTIVVSNNGPNAVTAAVVKDLLAANADITSDTFTVSTTGGAADTTNASTGSGSINDTVNMPAASTITYTVTANIGATKTGTLTNTATVATPANVADPVPTNNSATDSDSLTPQVDLVVTKTDNSGGSVVPGTQVTYTITVENTGPSNAVGVKVADSLPAGIANDTFAATGTSGASGFTASGSGSIDDTAVNLTSGASITYTVVANVAASATGTLSNTATATAGSGETNTNPNEIAGVTSAIDTDSLTPYVDLLVTKTDSSGGDLVPGQSVTYTINVQNIGPSNAVGLTVADLVPAGITSDSFTATGTSGASGFTASGNDSIDDTSVNLASGSSVTYTLTANVSSAATGTLTNTATATVASGETNTNPNEVSGATSATDADTLTPLVDLLVTKTDSGGGSSAGAGTTGMVVPGEAIVYTITVQNTGPSDAVGAAVVDTLPAGITSDTYSAIGTSGAAGFTASGSGNIDDASVNLASGSSITYTVTANVSAAATGTLND